MSNGLLTPVSRTTGPEFENFIAGYMAVSPNGRFLYASNEVENYDGKFSGGGMLTFAINPTDGSITHVSTQPSMGVYPAYVAIDKGGSRVIVANHGNYDPSVRVVKKNGVPEIEKVWDDGTVALFPVRQDGSLGSASDVAILERTQSVDEYSQRSAHAHSVNFDPSNRIVFACDKGTDRVYTYRVDRAAGMPTIPASYTQRSSPADVHVHPNGKFVYGSNRGHDSLAIFRIDEATGRLTLVDIVPTQGSTPRAFNFDPSGRYIFAANQGANNIVTFAVDSNSGKLTPTGAKVDVPKPVCIQFAML
jgi:6-phosphogluconolactonase